METKTNTDSSNRTTSSSLPLQDRVAIVTGSSRGIGKAIAIYLASLGAKLVINYVSRKDKADAVANEINSSWNVSDNNPRAIVVQADVSEPSQVKLLFDEAERVFGTQVHVLVNNAAVPNPRGPCPLSRTDVNEFDRTFSINCRGTFLCCKEAARGGGGRIILFSTSGVSLLIPNFASYITTKAAVEAMTKILAKELKGTAITVNCVAPGSIVTDMLLTAITDEEQMKIMAEKCPHGRLGETSDVAPIVGFLATDASEWINGQVIGANGGSV